MRRLLTAEVFYSLSQSQQEGEVIKDRAYTEEPIEDLNKSYLVLVLAN